jgi:hypothetical protein
VSRIGVAVSNWHEMTIQQSQIGTRTSGDALELTRYVPAPGTEGAAFHTDSKIQALSRSAHVPSAEAAENYMPEDWLGACIHRERTTGKRHTDPDPADLIPRGQKRSWRVNWLGSRTTSGMRSLSGSSGESGRKKNAFPCNVPCAIQSNVQRLVEESAK